MNRFFFRLYSITEFIKYVKKSVHKKKQFLARLPNRPTTAGLEPELKNNVKIISFHYFCSLFV